MDRRTFLGALGVDFSVAPLVVEAQQTRKVSRIGVLGTSPPAAATGLHAFRKGMQERGYLEGQHIYLDYRWAEGGRDGHAALAAGLVKGNFDVVLTIGAGAARAAKRATDAVPIVFCSMGSDPVELGLVTSLARPGGNATGVVILSQELEAKRLELLKEAVPGLMRAAVLWNASVQSHAQVLEEVAQAGSRLGVQIIPVEWKDSDDIEKAFQLARHERVGGVLALAGPETWRAREQIGRVSVEHQLVTVGSEPGFAAAGNLVQYGPDLSESCRRAAFYVVSILKGANPAEMPVEQPTTFRLVINLKTAKALGLAIPPSLLGRADELLQ